MSSDNVLIIQDLQKEIVIYQQKLLMLRMKNGSNNLKNTSEIKSLKKTIARLYTKISENKRVLI